MKLSKRKSLPILQIGIGLGLFLTGCGRTKPEATIAKAVAPKVVEKQADAAVPKLKFVDVTEQSGIKFIHQNGFEGEKLLPETMGSGVSILDFDGDGLMDLFFVNGCTWGDIGITSKPPGGKPETLPQRTGPPNKTQALYRNAGAGKFEDVTAKAGLADTFFGQGSTVGDIDNDGDPDLIVTGLNTVRLYQNNSGKFTDVSKAHGIAPGKGWYTSAAFFDLENDGDLDLFVCSYVDWSAEFDRAQGFQLAGTGSGRAYGPPTAFPGSYCLLYRNEGGGKFVDHSEKSGIRIKTTSLGAPFAKSLGVAPQDCNGDGFIDLAVANDTVPNFLLINKGDGTFDEVGVSSGVALDQSGSARGAMGIDWGDFSNDEALGLAIGNFANEMTALYVADDQKSAIFTDRAAVYGLGAATQPPLKFGLFFLDFDLDGRLDLLSTNGHLESDITKVQASQSYAQSAQIFWNSGKMGRNLFRLMTADDIGGDILKPIVGRGSACFDMDNDGDLDVVMTENGGRARLYRNDLGESNKSVRLKLVGKKSSRDGLGLKLLATSGDKSLRLQHFLARSYLSSLEPMVTIGAGSTGKIEKLELTWPSGTRQTLTDVVSGKVTIVEEP
jgi:hypothetical protein